MAFLLIFILFFLAIFPTPNYAEKFGKKAGQTKPMDSSPSFTELDLQKRPLNLYIIANGKHAVALNKTLATAKSLDQNSTDYRIARPPFLIKQRGSAILLNGGNSLDWHWGYPSMIQMMAASGHAAVAIEGGDNLGRIGQVIEWEELHGLALLGMGKKGSEMAMEAMGKGETRRLLDQLDAVILVNPTEGTLTKMEVQVKRGIGPKQPFWVLLIGGPSFVGEPSDFLRGNERVKIVKTPIDMEEPKNAEKLAQIMVNLLDFVHPR